MTGVRRMVPAGGVPSVIDRFMGEWRFLSNFAPCPWIVFEEDVYPTVEHAFQAAKTDDTRVRDLIRKARTAGHAKRMGRVTRLPAGWGELRVQIMRDLLWQKFSPKRQPDYLLGLLRTGDVMLIEGNDWGDRFWGVCDGQGANMLGQLLMDIRRERRQRGDGINA